MNLDTVIANIEKKLSLANYTSIISDMKKILESGSTGGEIIAYLGNYLINLEKTNEDVYFLIKKEIDQYKQFTE